MPTSPDQSNFLKGFIDSLGTSKPEYLFYLTKALGYSPTCECEGCGGTNGGPIGMKLACQHGYINYPYANATLEALRPSVAAYWDEDVLTINVFGAATHFGLDGVLIRLYAYPMGDGLNDWIPGELLSEYDIKYSSGDPLMPDGIFTKTGVQYVPGISIGEIPHNKQYVDFSGAGGFLERSLTHGFTGTISIPEEILTKPREHFINKLSIHAAVIYPERVMYEVETNNLTTLGMALCGSLVIDIPEKPIVIPPPTISCEGATQSALLESIEPEQWNPEVFHGADATVEYYSIEVNGVNHGMIVWQESDNFVVLNTLNTFPRIMGSRYVRDPLDLGVGLINFSSNDLRVRLIPITDDIDSWADSPLHIHSENTNPTIEIDETTKIVSFCLSGVEALSWAEVELSPADSYAVYVDDVFIGSGGSINYTLSGDSRFTVLEPGGHLVQIHNNDSVEHFIELKPISPGDELSTIADPEKTPLPNPTINCNNFDSSASFRLAPDSNISCAGATTEAGFSEGFEGAEYDFYLNGVYCGFDSVPFNEYGFPEFVGIFSTYYDGFYYINNLTSTEQRIKFVCKQDAWVVPIIDSSNPTIHIDEATKTITFCLAGVTP